MSALILMTASSLFAKDAVLDLSEVGRAQIRGGEGAREWTLTYGVDASRTGERQPKLLNTSKDRAWFVNGGWLRLVDTQEGKVIGLWHLVDYIGDLKAEGDGVQIKVISDPGGRDSKLPAWTVVKPGSPPFPFSFPDNLMMMRVPFAEAEVLAHVPLTAALDPIKDHDKAAASLPQVAEMAQRDPLSPWFSAMEGTLRRFLKEPGADECYERAVSVSNADYTEMFPISSFLMAQNELRFSERAFERGYKDYLERGNDPRLFEALIARVVLMPALDTRNMAWPAEIVDAGLEHTYRLMPNMEGAAQAWRTYGDYLLAHGQVEAGKTWIQRSQVAEKSGFMLPMVRSTDWGILMFLGGMLGIWTMLGSQWMRFTSQRQLDNARPGDFAPGRAILRFTSIPYWSAHERFALLVTMALAWMGAGWAATQVTAVLRLASAPVSVLGGSFASTHGVWYLEQALPKSPERDLLLADAYAGTGKTGEAELLYRAQPRSARAWNNLGVLQSKAGRASEARASFERALQLDPSLAEAKLNLGQEPTDFWTRNHHNYLPTQPMAAVPSGNEIRRAMRGTGNAGAVLYAMAGALAGDSKVNRISEETSLFGPTGRILFTLLLAGMIALIFFSPFFEVTQAPRQWHAISEYFLPGTAPEWGMLRAIAIPLWAMAVFACFFVRAAHSPFPLSAEMSPSTWGFGLPRDAVAAGDPWNWVPIAAIVFLYAVNWSLLAWKRKARARSMAA